MPERKNINMVKRVACAGLLLSSMLFCVLEEKARRRERAARKSLESHICTMGDSSACALVMLYSHRYDLVEEVLKKNVARTSDLIGDGEILIDDDNTNDWLKYLDALRCVERYRKKWPDCSESLKPAAK